MKNTYCPLPPLNTVYIDRSVLDRPFVTDILKNISAHKEYESTQIKYVTDYREVIRETSLLSPAEAKKVLLIYPEKGQYLHACPGSDGVVCCRYFVLDFGINCPYDCHYCYLQTYAKVACLTLAGNLEELLEDLRRKIASTQGIHWRIGTGEYMDSLALEQVTGMGRRLVQFFASIENATLELKTKSVEIDSLLNLEHNNNTVISWSLNPDYIIENVEIHCSTLDMRLEAARKAVDAGYQTAFHFDPIILYKNWENDYREVIDRLFSTIPSAKIRWISLGTFRYTPGLKEVLRSKYPNEFITRGELLPGAGNKFRYIAPERNQMYTTLRNRILYHDPRMMVYLCMETRNAWKRLTGEDIGGPALLDRQFENRRLYLNYT